MRVGIFCCQASRNDGVFIAGVCIKSGLHCQFVWICGDIELFGWLLLKVCAINFRVHSIYGSVQFAQKNGTRVHSSCLNIFRGKRGQY